MKHFFPDHALEIQHQLRLIALIAEQEARAKLHYSTKRNAERGFLFLRLRGPEIASTPADNRRGPIFCSDGALQQSV
jgi:hypothetical protein